MANVANVKILNGSDKTRHYTVCMGEGAIAEATDPIVTDVNKFPIGSQYTDLTGKLFYVRVAGAKAVADWQSYAKTA